MAIIKTYINNDITALYNFLVANGTDYFTNVVNNTSYVSCYVGDLEFLQIRTNLAFSNGITIKTNYNQSTSIYNNYTGWAMEYAYLTANALVFSAAKSGTSYRFSIIITKDNNNKPTIIIIGNNNTADTFSPSVSGSNVVYAISTDSEIIDTIALQTSTGKATTAMCPVIVSGVSTKYTPKVYFTPFVQYSVQGNFLINNVLYLCNGIIAVEDE